MRVAVLGLGLMGLPMARRLCQAGLEVHVWNRTAAKAEELLPLGATVHLTPALAVAQADLSITMLNTAALWSLLFSIMALRKPCAKTACLLTCRLSSRPRPKTMPNDCRL